MLQHIEYMRERYEKKNWYEYDYINLRYTLYKNYGINFNVMV